MTFQAKMFAKPRLLTRYLLACWRFTWVQYQISRYFNYVTFVVRRVTFLKVFFVAKCKTYNILAMRTFLFRFQFDKDRPDH
jgi:hypothetical protein